MPKIKVATDFGGSSTKVIIETEAGIEAKRERSEKIDKYEGYEKWNIRNMTTGHVLLTKCIHTSDMT